MTGPKTLIWDCELKPNIVSAWSLFKPVISIDQIVDPAGIICFGYRWRGGKRTLFSSEWDDGYSDMIATLHALFEEADVVVGYNNVSFDDKHARAAFLTEGLAPPSPYKQLDLYQEVRRNFNFPSRKLDYICQRLGLGAKVKHTGQALWNEVLRPSSEESGRKARKLMARYCATDVNLTADLYDLLYPWLRVPINAGLFIDEDEPVCPACGSDSVQSRGFAYSTHLRYRRFYCGGCQRWSRGKRCEKVSELRPA